jgi:hypothetical protein
MPKTVLEPGGFGFMESRVKHQFSCESSDDCILFVTFDRTYDVFWVAPDGFSWNHSGASVHPTVGLLAVRSMQRVGRLPVRIPTSIGPFP